MQYKIYPVMLNKTKIKNIALKYTPHFVGDIYCSYQGWIRKRHRFCYPFQKYYEFYREAANWPEAKLIDYQNKKLSELVNYCYQNVPYYKTVFDHIGIHPNDIKTIEDLPKLPYLNKDKAKQAGTDLISREFNPKSLFSSHTGGSTGTPAKIYFSPETWPANYAFLWARWRPGVSRNDRFASLQGQTLIDHNRNTPPFWRTNYVGKQRLYSVFHLSEKNLKYYFENLDSFKPVYIQGYPSAMFILAEYMGKNNLSFKNPLKAVFSMSETVQSQHVNMIKEVWKCPFWDQYSAGERNASITLYECGNYHYDMDFSIIEFETVSQDDDNEIAEVVGTSFINRAWPLIRYRMGDLVVMEKNGNCKCGRPGPVIKSIMGRTGDIIETIDGRRIMNITTAVKDIPHLLEFQIVQRKKDLIVANIVKNQDYCSQDENLILSRLNERLGPATKIKLNYVERIKRTSGGKFKAIVSEI